ncbi:MAG: DUF4148 domain-containing protein [Comamonadaceae bacterium]|nr:MAG: DUF4148 domain-containing protein [Comamonadaceae bacterium]
MKATRLLLVAALSTAALAAQADPFDAPEFAQQFSGSRTRAEVQADLQQYRQAGVNPWSTSFNPLKGFQGQRTRAQVQGEYIASRNAVAAFTGEDSGSAYLAAHKVDAPRQFAGQPVTAR